MNNPDALVNWDLIEQVVSNIVIFYLFFLNYPKCWVHIAWSKLCEIWILGYNCFRLCFAINHFFIAETFETTFNFRFGTLTLWLLFICFYFLLLFLECSSIWIPLMSNMSLSACCCKNDTLWSYLLLVLHTTLFNIVWQNMA